MDNDVEIKLETFQGTGKNGNKFECFKLIIGEYETLIFTRSNMEKNYLTRLIEEGVL